jgi:hypothetical protein
MYQSCADADTGRSIATAAAEISCGYRARPDTNVAFIRFPPADAAQDPTERP